MSSEMTDRKPYLLRAIYQWIVDNGCTPHLVIAYPGKGWVSGAPEHLMADDTLVLNISPAAAPDCVIENDAIYFTTRFGGVSHSIAVAIEAVAALVSRENQEGMGFEIGPEISEGTKSSVGKPPEMESTKPAGSKRSNHLKIIK